MTRLSWLLAWFPALIVGLAIADVTWFGFTRTWYALLLLPLILYGLPLGIYHLHNWRYPIAPGISYLQDEQTYSPWWGSHQIQLIYIAFPSLETLLRLVPGLFSQWLRLWGAEIGQSVYWTPRGEIADRGLLSIGDRVIIGHQVGLYSHVIKPRKQNLMLYVQPIKIGDDVFIGSASAIGPGVEIESGTFIKVKTDLFPNSKR